MRRSAGLLAVAAVVTALLSAPAAQGAEKTPTASRPRRRGRDRRHARHEGRDRDAASAAATPSTRPSTAAGVLGVVEPFSCGIGGGGFMVIRDAQGQHHDDRPPREGAGGDDADVVLAERQRALAFDPARYSGMSARRARAPALGWERGARPLRHDLAAQGAQAGRADRAAAASSSTRCSATRSPATAPTSTTSRRPPSCTSTPAAQPRAVGTRAAQPGPGRDVRARRPARRRARLLPRPDRRTRSSPPARDPPTVAQPAHPWLPGVMTARRPARLHRAVPRADEDLLPRARRLRHGPAVERRHDRRRGAEHPRGLPRLRPRPRAVAAPLPRGVAARVRRPQRVPRRPGVLRRAAARPAVGLVRGRAAPADRRDQANNATVPAGNPRDNGGPGRTTATVSHPNQSTTHLSVADRKGNVVSYTFTIESIGGNAIVVPGWGFLLNNELTDFNYDSTTHPNKAEGGKRPRSSMAPTIVQRARQAVPGDRLAGRLADPDDRPADVHQPGRPRDDAAAGDRRAARQPAQRPDDDGRAGVHQLAGGAGAGERVRPRVRARRRRRGEIGVIAAIEFLRGGKLPRRHGADVRARRRQRAMVVRGSR